VLDVRVARRDGTTSLSLVLRGLQVVADDGDVDVVNLSLSSQSPLPYQLDPLTLALERLWDRGVTVVVPAGNDGPQPGTLSSPGIHPALLTTGGLDEGGTATRGDDAVATWSGRGSGKSGPDLVAPGVHLISTLSPGSAAAAAQTSTGLPPGYGAGSGTSFSAAVVSGAAAALLGERDLTPDQVADLLTRTAYRTAQLRDRSAAGAGGLDLAAAASTRARKAEPRKAEPRKADDSSGPAADGAAFLSALLGEDEDAAAEAWERLSPAARQWVARQWTDLSPSARQWAGAAWTARQWAGAAWTARQWTARQWTARQWTAQDWS
jgi:serine protease AprX